MVSHKLLPLPIHLQRGDNSKRLKPGSQGRNLALTVLYGTYKTVNLALTVLYVPYKTVYVPYKTVLLSYMCHLLLPLSTHLQRHMFVNAATCWLIRRANVAHVRKSSPDSGLGVQVKVPNFCSSGSLFARKRLDRHHVQRQTCVNPDRLLAAGVGQTRTLKLRAVPIGTAFHSRTTTLQKCAVVPRRARI